jgi:hypothetical protein
VASYALLSLCLYRKSFHTLSGQKTVTFHCSSEVVVVKRKISAPARNRISVVHPVVSHFTGLFRLYQYIINSGIKMSVAVLLWMPLVTVLYCHFLSFGFNSWSAFLKVLKFLKLQISLLVLRMDLLLSSYKKCRETNILLDPADRAVPDLRTTGPAYRIPQNRLVLERKRRSILRKVMISKALRLLTLFKTQTMDKSRRK